MVWNSQSCVTEISNFFKQGKDHGRISNTTCLFSYCNNNRLEWYCYIVITLWLLVLLLGILGNASALFCYIYTVKSWTTSTVFLFNLALCDFTWILLIPFSAYYHLHKQAAYSIQIFCQFKKTFFDINIYGSIYFLTLISFDRYIGAVHPIRSLKWWNKNRAVFCTTAIWIFIFIESIPDFYYMLVVQREREAVACLDNIVEPLYYMLPVKISRVLFGFLIPITVIFTCYALTLKALRKMKACQQRRHRIVKPLILVSAAMIVFAVAFIPYHIMIMAVLIYRMNYQLNSENISLIFIIYKLTEIICCISSCLNPFIFMLASKKCQKTLKTIQCSPKHRCFCCPSHKVRDIAAVM